MPNICSVWEFLISAHFLNFEISFLFSCFLYLAATVQHSSATSTLALNSPTFTSRLGNIQRECDQQVYRCYAKSIMPDSHYIGQNKMIHDIGGVHCPLSREAFEKSLSLIHEEGGVQSSFKI